MKYEYDWDLTEVLKVVGDEQIIGIEAPLWSEMLNTIKDIEFMTFPRLMGIAEIGWSSKEGRDWGEYKERLAAFRKLLEMKTINFYESDEVDW